MLVPLDVDNEDAMATSAARFHRMQSLLSFTSHAGSSSCSRGLLHLPNHRHAMISAMSHSGPSRPTPNASSNPVLGQTPPVVIPAQTSGEPSAKSLSADAASPQIAARPPPAPKVERRRPTIKSTKAAISLVCSHCDHGLFTYLISCSL